MEENKGVTPDSPTGNGSEPEKTQPAPVVAEPTEPQKPPKGFVPYQALEEERKLRKEAEEKLEKSVPLEEPDDDVFSDEGKVLKGEIGKISEKLRSIEQRESRREAEIEFPFLKDKKEEFEAFLEDEENKRLSIKKAAKLFAAELGMLAPEAPRKGLEKPTGGGQVAPEAKYSPEEIRNLMKNDWKTYERLLKEGKI